MNFLFLYIQKHSLVIFCIQDLNLRTENFMRKSRFELLEMIKTYAEVEVYFQFQFFRACISSSKRVFWPYKHLRIIQIGIFLNCYAFMQTQFKSENNREKLKPKKFLTFFKEKIFNVPKRIKSCQLKIIWET